MTGSAPEGEAVRVAAFLAAAARGDLRAVSSALARWPELARAEGNHPFLAERCNALQLAAAWGRTEVLRALLDAGAEPDATAPGSDGWRPLLAALARGQREIAAILLAQHVPLDVFAACLLGDAELLARLLDEDPARAAARGPGGATPLHFATEPELACVLLAHDADVTATDRRGNTPGRVLASRPVQHPAAELVLARSGESDVWLAAARDKLTELALLLDADPGRLVELTREEDCLGGFSGAGALHVAAETGAENALALLLERGAPADLESRAGHTPLHAAAAAGEEATAGLLLLRGAAPNAVDARHGATPSDWATFRGQDEIVQLLTRHGGKLLVLAPN